MKLHAEPISKDAFGPYGELVPREREPGRMALSDLVTWNDPDARLVAEFSVREGTRPPVVVPKMERHRHSAQLFFPVDVEHYLVAVAPDDRAGAPELERVQAFVVPGDLCIVYAIDVWHFPMCALGTPGSFVMLMGKSGTGRDEEWTSLPSPLEIDVP